MRDTGKEAGKVRTFHRHTVGEGRGRVRMACGGEGVEKARYPPFGFEWDFIFHRKELLFYAKTLLGPVDWSQKEPTTENQPVNLVIYAVL